MTAVLIVSAVAAGALMVAASLFDTAVTQPVRGSWQTLCAMLLVAGALSVLLAQPVPVLGAAAVTVAVVVGGFRAGRWLAVALCPAPYLGAAVVISVFFRSDGDPAAVLTLVLVAPVASVAAAAALALGVALRLGARAMRRTHHAGDTAT
jgi:hypothetical protein